ncbi:MAG TPA: helix-turn-helix domain-containing protein [Kineosporiaceae bacterium]
MESTTRPAARSAWNGSVERRTEWLPPAAREAPARASAQGPLPLSGSARRELLGLATGSTGDEVRRSRALIVLLAADGHSNAAIAARVGVSLPTVLRWQRRYLDHGLRGLGDDERTGRPRAVDRELIVRTTARPPSGRPAWTCRALAHALGVSAASVSRCWREVGLAPQRTGTLKFGTRPFLEARHFVIVGQCAGIRGRAAALLLDPPTPAQGVLGPVASPGELVRSAVRRFGSERLHVVCDPFAASTLRDSPATRAWWSGQPRLCLHETAPTQPWQSLVAAWAASVGDTGRDDVSEFR